MLFIITNFNQFKIPEMEFPVDSESGKLENSSEPRSNVWRRLKRLFLQITLMPE